MTKEKENKTKLLKTINQLEKITKRIERLVDLEKTSFAYDLLCGCPLFINCVEDVSVLIKTLNEFSKFLNVQNIKMKIASENENDLSLKQVENLCNELLSKQCNEKLILRPSKYEDKLTLYLERKTILEIFGE